MFRGIEPVVGTDILLLVRDKIGSDDLQPIPAEPAGSLGGNQWQRIEESTAKGVFVYIIITNTSEI